MTSSIARMNSFLHGIEDFRIERGDTLSEPKLVQGDRLMRFDVVLANPPYSIKQWDRDTFASDPWGRNRYGTPPQGRADYAFWQHILHSLAPKTGRCAILFPHGVLFRQEEADMRRKLIEADLIECVLGLGPNLFYNSPMEACVVICRTAKAKERRNKALFINAVNQVTRERAQSFLTDDHIGRIVKAYEAFKSEPGFTRVVALEEIRAKEGNLSIPLYVAPSETAKIMESRNSTSLAVTLDSWLTSRKSVAKSLRSILPDIALSTVNETLNGLEPCALFDRLNWQRVRFGDAVENLNETERDPAEAGIERFIGLEHLEAGSLHVRAWGNVADGTTFTRRCRPGQVLFGKRRAYQRKVAVAEFDAVVSGDIYVLTPKNNRLLPELLPFLCMSERFFKFAVETSAGSLSPRTNWKHLAAFEFVLPPLDQQRRIAEILWAVDEAITSKLTVLDRLRAAHDSEFYNGKQKHVVPQRLENFATLITDGDHNPPKRTASGIPHTLVQNIIDGKINLSNCTYISEADFEWVKKRYAPRKNDILIVCVGATIGRAGMVGDFEEFSTDRSLVVVRFDSAKILPDYGFALVTSHAFQVQIQQHSVGTAQPHLFLGDIRRIKVAVPPISEQQRVLEVLQQLASAQDTIVCNLSELRKLREQISLASLEHAYV